MSFAWQSPAGEGIQWEPPLLGSSPQVQDDLRWPGRQASLPSRGFSETSKDSLWPSPIFEAGLEAMQLVPEEGSTYATSSSRFVDEVHQTTDLDAQDPVVRCLDFSDECLEQMDSVQRPSEVCSQAPVPASGRRALEVAKELELLLGWLLSERMRERDRIDSKLALLRPLQHGER